MISSTGACVFVVSARSFCEMARLTPFEIGQIKAHAEHDLSAPAIAARVIKSDGHPVGRQAVLYVLAKLHADLKWRGGRAEGSGRKRKTSPALHRSWVGEHLAIGNSVVLPLPRKQKLCMCVNVFGLTTAPRLGH